MFRAFIFSVHPRETKIKVTRC